MYVRWIELCDKIIIIDEEKNRETFVCQPKTKLKKNEKNNRQVFRYKDMETE